MGTEGGRMGMDLLSTTSCNAIRPRSVLQGSGTAGSASGEDATQRDRASQVAGGMRCVAAAQDL